MTVFVEQPLTLPGPAHNWNGYMSNVGSLSYGFPDRGRWQGSIKQSRQVAGFPKAIAEEGRVP